ncbi:MAG: hypothetical protein WDW38_010384 [Sanguina aurantia]
MGIPFPQALSSDQPAAAPLPSIFKTQLSRSASVSRVGSSLIVLREQELLLKNPTKSVKPRVVHTPPPKFYRCSRLRSNTKLFAAMTPDLAAAVAAHARRSRGGYQEFVHQLTQNARQSGTPMRFRHFACAAAAQWRGMSAESRQPFFISAVDSNTSWLQERVMLEARLKQAGHPFLPWDKVSLQPASTPSYLLVKERRAQTKKLPYIRFLTEVYHSVAETFPPSTAAPPVAKAIAQMWRVMSEEGKRPYQAAYTADLLQQRQTREQLQSPIAEERRRFEDMALVKRERLLKKLVPLKAERKPMTGRAAVSYVRFSREVFQSVSAALPPSNAAHMVSRHISKMWREMTDAQKQPYRDAYLSDQAALRQSVGTPVLEPKPKAVPKVKKVPTHTGRAAAAILTPALAVAAATHPRKPPNGYQLFMEELRTGNSPLTNTYTPSTDFTVSRAASRRWAVLSPAQQQPYYDAADEAARSWLDQHTNLDSLLRATGHAGLQPPRPSTALKLIRSCKSRCSPTPLELYLSQIPPELAREIRAHPRRPPYGLNMFARAHACALGTRSETSTNVRCASGADYNAAAKTWKLLSPAEREPWDEKGRAARQQWQAERDALDAWIAAAGHPPSTWSRRNSSPGPYNCFKAERAHETAITMQTGTIKRGRNTVLAAAWQSLSDEERGKYREGYAAKRQQAASLAESRALQTHEAFKVRATATATAAAVPKPAPSETQIGAQRSFLAQRFASVAGSLPPGSSSTEVESVVREMWRALPPKERYTHTLRYTRGQKRLMLRTSGDPAMAARISVTGHGPYNIFKAERLHEAAGTALPGSSRQALGEVLLAAWHRLPEQERGTYREAYAARRREAAAAAASRVSACCGPYYCFKAERLQEVTDSAHPGSSVVELNRLLVAAWRKLPQAERTKYHLAFAAKRHRAASAAESRSPAHRPALPGTAAAPVSTSSLEQYRTDARLYFVAARYQRVADAMPAGSSSSDVESALSKMWEQLPLKRRYAYTRQQKPDTRLTGSRS